MDKDIFGKHRIDAVLTGMNFCTNRSAKNFILKNEILVNGKKIISGKAMVDSSDEIKITGKTSEGKKIESTFRIGKDIYVVIDKPGGIVCSRASDSHKTVYEWLSEQDIPNLEETDIKRLHSVGRLDAKTTGLLILTSDGFFSNFVTNPESRIRKQYAVTLKEKANANLQKEYSDKAKEGILLPAEKKFNEEKASSALIEWMSENECAITVTEGKFHEVRRIFSALGNEVAELRRISIGEFNIQHLQKKAELISDMESFIQKLLS